MFRFTGRASRQWRWQRRAARNGLAGGECRQCGTRLLNLVPRLICPSCGAELNPGKKEAAVALKKQ